MIKLTEKEIERRKKISKKLTGFKRPTFSKEHIKKLRLTHLGKKLSEESKLKLSKAFKGRISPMKGRNHSEETINKMRGRKAWNKGIPNPNFCGDKNPFWKGGVTPINTKIRHSVEYKLWRESVFQRDNWTCVWCGLKSGTGKTVVLNADHIKPFYLYPELRFAIDNGRTLCVECHRKTETYKRPKKYEKN